MNLRSSLVVFSPTSSSLSSFLKKGDFLRPLQFLDTYCQFYDKIHLLSMDRNNLASKKYQNIVFGKEIFDLKKVEYLLKNSFSSPFRLLNIFLFYFSVFFIICLKVRNDNLKLHTIKSYGIPSLFFSSFASKFLGVKLITYYDWNWAQSGKSLLLERYLLSHCDVIIVSTEKLYEKINNLFPEKKIKIIPNGLNLDIVESQRVRLNNFSKRVVAYVGRLEPEKKIHEMIDFFESLESHFHLVICGTGSLSKFVKQKSLQSSNITYLSERLNNLNVYKLLHWSDMSVLFSESEGHPVFVLESWACGNLVLINNVDGLNNLIRNKFDGYIVNYTDKFPWSDFKSCFNSQNVENNLKISINDYDHNFISKSEIRILEEL